jgi:hypothetical protein
MPARHRPRPVVIALVTASAVALGILAFGRPVLDQARAGIVEALGTRSYLAFDPGRDPFALPGGRISVVFPEEPRELPDATRSDSVLGGKSYAVGTSNVYGAGYLDLSCAVTDDAADVTLRGAALHAVGELAAANNADSHAITSQESRTVSGLQAVHTRFTLTTGAHRREGQSLWVNDGARIYAIVSLATRDEDWDAFSGSAVFGGTPRGDQAPCLAPASV